MNEQEEPKEWQITEELPEAFVLWLRAITTEKETAKKKGLVYIAEELGVKPSIFSRWLAGMGPLNQENIRTLANHLGPSVFTVLGLPWPNDPPSNHIPVERLKSSD